MLLPLESASERVGFHGARAAAQLPREASAFGIAGAAVGVNVDRAGLRQRLFARETIVGKKNPAFLWCDSAQAVAAWRGVLGDFQVSREAVNRRLQRGADLLLDLGFNSQEANVLHEYAPPMFVPSPSCGSNKSL